MAIYSATDADYPYRVATYLNPRQNFTVRFDFYLPDANTGNRILLQLDGGVLGTYTPPWINIGSVATLSQDYGLFVDPGTGEVDGLVFTPSLAAWHTLYLLHDVVAHTFEIVLDTFSLGTISADFSAAGPFLTESLAADGNVMFATRMAFGYARVWQALLTSAERTLEDASMIAVKRTSLLADCPLQASIDLTAHNNAATQYTATGTVITQLNDRLLATVASPPTNLAPASAATITPDSAIFQDTLLAGVAQTLWFKSTAPVASVVKGACAFGDLTTYKPTLTVYEGLANALANTPYLSIAAQQNAPIQFPVTPGLDYYYKVVPNGTPSPATLKMSVLVALNLPVPIGSLAVNDDTGGFPLALLRASDAYPIQFRSPFPAGEGGCPLADGRTLVIDNDNNNAKLFDAALGSLGSVALTDYQRIASNQVDRFVAGIPNTGMVHAFLSIVSAAGVIDPTVYDLGSAGLWAVGVNQAVTIAYYVQSSAVNQPIKRWDLTGNVALANFLAGVANFNSIKDILVLKDDTVLVGYVKATVTRSFVVKRYDPAAVLQNTYTIGGAVDGDIADNRMCASPDDPDSFMVWSKSATTPGTSTFQQIRVSDGVVLATGIGPQYEDGLYQPAPSNTPVRFGHSESCPFWTVRVAIAAGPLPPPPPAVRRLIRRTRRFPLPFDRQLWVYLDRIEFVMQQGPGLTLGQGSDPQIEVTFSEDGGKTWGPVIYVPAGEIGQYMLRPEINRIGRFQNGVCEISVSDPVLWYFLQALVDATMSRS